MEMKMLRTCASINFSSISVKAYRNLRVIQIHLKKFGDVLLVTLQQLPVIKVKLLNNHNSFIDKKVTITVLFMTRK